MLPLHCQLPLKTIEAPQRIANDNTVLISTIENFSTIESVRILQHKDDSDQLRFALTGKMADVCAALDFLASQEQRKVHFPGYGVVASIAAWQQ